MTAPCRRLPIVVLLVVLACALGGCITFEQPTGPVSNMDKRLYEAQKAVSFKVGDTWLVRPPYEINATGIVLTRTNLSAPAAEMEAMEEPAPPPDTTPVEPSPDAPADTAAAPRNVPTMSEGVVDVEAEAAASGPQPRPTDKFGPNQQRLSIDLVTGRATLRDTDGRVYPQQIDRKVAERIHAMLLERKWQVKSPPPARDAEPVYRYRLDIYNADYRYPETVTWHAPANKPLPPALQMLVSTFQVAHRYAYPLSEDINLLR